MGNHKIMTVRGEVSSEQIQNCLMHEHILFGYPGWWGAAGGFDREKALRETSERLLALKEEYGVNMIVDATPGDCGRDVVFLKEVSEMTDVHIVASSGYYYEGEGATAYFKLRATMNDALDGIDRMMRKELLEGVGDTGIRTGIIKVATSEEEISPYEDMFLRVAANISAETGIRIITHTQGGRQGSEQSRRLQEYGASADHIMIGHLDGCSDINELLAIFASGTYGAFDRLGLENLAGVIPEESRLALIAGLCAGGYSDRLMLSHDFIGCLLGETWNYTPEQQEAVREWHWEHIFDTVLPRLKEAGLSPETVDAFVGQNAKSFLFG